VKSCCGCDEELGVVDASDWQAALQEHSPGVWGWRVYSRYSEAAAAAQVSVPSESLTSRARGLHEAYAMRLDVEYCNLEWQLDGGRMVKWTRSILDPSTLDSSFQ
jgi:hypothetical protein